MVFREGDYRCFFEQVTGFPPIDSFQTRLAALLADGQSVILRAPTGAGKTWATVAPFLFQASQAEPMADRLLYALPLRALAAALYGSTQGAITKAGLNLSCALQMGGQADDPFFEADVTFTTIDQLLSGYLSLPVSLADRVANIPPGALIGSYVVFDEMHLLDPDASLGTMIEMLDRIRKHARFVLMSATLSDESVASLARQLGAVGLTLTPEQVRELPSQQGKRRAWSRDAGALTAEAILREHRGGRTIAIFNSVTRAQDAFEELRERWTGADDALMLLHSRFYPDDRQVTEAKLARYFGPEATRSEGVLVSTQVVEAGMDLSAEVLLSEMAPVNALVQRAGRSARYATRCEGHVRVFPVPQRYPYEQLPLADTTALLEERLTDEARLVDAVEEQEWVEQVHLPEERRAIRKFQSLGERRDLVHRAMNEGERGLLSTLVRDIDSVAVLITTDPDTVDFSGRFRGWPRLLSVPRGTLIGAAVKMLEGQGAEVYLWSASEGKNDERPGFALDWAPISSPKAVGAAWLVALTPEVAAYDERLGLRLNRAGVAAPVSYLEKAPLTRYSYRMETWADHARRVTEQGRERIRDHACGVRAVAQGLEVGSEVVEDLIRLVCALHDTGKLSEAWQSEAWKHQAKKRPDLKPGSFFLAHTDYDPRFDRKANLPPHAVEGAFGLGQLLENAVLDHFGERGANGILESMFSAVARHHAPRARQLKEIEWRRGANSEVAQAAALVEAELLTPGRADAEAFGKELVRIDSSFSHEAWAFERLLIRILRLADQEATRQS